MLANTIPKKKRIIFGTERRPSAGRLPRNKREDMKSPFDSSVVTNYIIRKENKRPETAKSTNSLGSFVYKPDTASTNYSEATNIISKSPKTRNRKVHLECMKKSSFSSAKNIKNKKKGTIDPNKLASKFELKGEFWML